MRIIMTTVAVAAAMLLMALVGGCTDENIIKPKVTMKATPISVQVGSPVMLEWTSIGATDVKVSNFGTNEVSGSMEVRPLATKTYTITVHGPGGDSKPASVTVTVTYL